MARLNATVLGLPDAGAELCAAVAADPVLELVAVADRDKARSQEAGARFGVPTYEDYRSAVIEPEAGVVIMALPPYERPEYLRLAAGRGLAVYACGPPLANVETAVEVARLFSEAGVPFVVSRFWQSEPAYAPLGEIETWAGRLFSANVNVISPAGDLQGWRGDSARAGGGVLLNDAYDQVDALVAVFGMPEEVYTVMPTTSDPNEMRSYDTEDAATVLMRFSAGRVATINCRRIGDQRYWRYRLHGTRATAWITPEEMVIADAEGRAPVSSKVRTKNRYAPGVSAFGRELTSGARIVSPLEEHLVTLAVIRTAYLSAKTGQPESPGRLYRIETGADASS